MTVDLDTLCRYPSVAWFRDVPRPEEVEGEGNLMPKYAENAEALIDWALSHVPPSKFSQYESLPIEHTEYFCRGAVQTLAA